MKLKSPSSPQARLFATGVALLLITGVLYGIASLLAGHTQVNAPGGANLGVSATQLALEMPISVFEFAGLSCIILAALVSIFRSILPPKAE